MTKDELLHKLEPLLEKISDTPYTMPFIFGKECDENFISDYLSFILNPALNGIGYEPLNILLGLYSDDQKISDDEYAKFEDVREKRLNDDSRIDLLIPVYKKTDSCTPEYYIAIENKIYSGEGVKQTERYFKALTKSDEFKCHNKGKNIYIFLYVKGNKAACEEFQSIKYENLIAKFKEKIDSNSISDQRCEFLFREFIAHMENHVIPSLTKNDCEILKLSKYITARIDVGEKNDTVKRAYNECKKIKDLFFKELYIKIQQELSYEEKWIVKKSRNSLYIQVFKKAWEEHLIHYEIIIDSKNSIPYPECKLLLMIHYEKSNKEKKKIFEEMLPKSQSEKFSRKNFKVYEESIDTSSGFETPDKVSELIENICIRLSALIEETEKRIDDFILNLKSKTYVLGGRTK